MSDEKKYRLAIGYRNSSDVEELREALVNTDIKVVSYDQDAQRVFDNAIRLDADIVLITPDCMGYRTAILQDLLFHHTKSIPVVGWVEARSDDGRQMMANGAAGYITLPLDAVQISNFVNLVHEVVERELKRRAQGETPAPHPAAAPEARAQAWQSRVVAVYVPKGGGSHRTTTAVNLRADASTSAKVIKVVPKGATVIDYDLVMSNGFRGVDYNGTVGWIYDTYLQKK